MPKLMLDVDAPLYNMGEDGDLFLSGHSCT